MRISLILATTLFVGCGIPGETLIADLTEDDANLICSHIDYDDVDRTVACDVMNVTVAATTYQDCSEYFATVREIANPACTAEFDVWKNCKREDKWSDDDALVCAVFEDSEDPPELSADCQAVVLCATPVE